MRSLITSILAQRVRMTDKEYLSMWCTASDCDGPDARRREARRSGVLPAMLLFIVSIFAGMPAIADQVDIWMQTPDGWEDRKSGLGRDLIKQVLAPGGVAVIEVYGSRGNNPGLRVIADRMEQEMLSRGAAYLRTRLSEDRRKTQDGHDAIFREYSGVHNGMPLRAIAVYTFGNGGAVAAFGFYAQNNGAQYRSAVLASIGSIRFSPPGSSATTTAGAASTPRATTASGCDAVIGTWKWFTGKNHTFGPNGTSSTAQVFWQCMDPQRRIIRINWNNGKWVDTVTISADGKRVEGRNQYGSRVWGVRHQRPAQPPVSQSTPSRAATTSKIPAKCTGIIGTWQSQENKRVIVVTADGFLDGNPRYTWSCNPDGIHYRFRWEDGARVIVWDDLRMDADKLHLTRRQAGSVWDRFVKVR